jgi:hypothetical protein
MKPDMRYIVDVKLLGGVELNRHTIYRLHAAIHGGINSERLAEGVAIHDPDLHTKWRSVEEDGPDGAGGQCWVAYPNPNHPNGWNLRVQFTPCRRSSMTSSEVFFAIRALPQRMRDLITSMVISLEKEDEVYIHDPQIELEATTKSVWVEDIEGKLVFSVRNVPWDNPDPSSVAGLDKKYKLYYDDLGRPALVVRNVLESHTEKIDVTTHVSPHQQFVAGRTFATVEVEVLT